LRAARIHAYGEPEELRVDEVDEPSVGPKDVLIAVRAAAVNPIDFKIRSGVQRAVVRLTLPHTLGMDAAGVVEAVGAQVTRFTPGDEVYCSPTHRRSGTYAEKVAVDESAVAFKPRNVSFAQAAGVPLAGLTAWQSLVDAANVQPGDRVLVQAGAGGVGSLGIQIAKHRGAHVITTCSPRNEALVRHLGADEVVNYREQDVVEAVGSCDVVFDTLGGQARDESLALLSRGGRMVSVMGGIPEAVSRHGAHLGVVIAVGGIVAFATRCLMRGVKFRYVVRKPDGDDLAELTALIEAGKIEPVVDSVLPLDEIVEAHRRSEAGRARGKIILAVDPDAVAGGAIAPPA
jgi:NADPH:quinone reductase-like Zn-dependent oxidoreductase